MSSSRRTALFAALVVLALAVAAVVVWLTVGRDDTTRVTVAASEPSTPAVRTVAGTLALSDGYDYEANTGCVGSGGYDDIRPGAQVVITDSTGATVGLGTLGVGRLGGHQPGDTDKCKFMFSVPGVPTGHDFYGVEVAHRGKVQYPEQQMFAALALTLG